MNQLWYRGSVAAKEKQSGGLLGRVLRATIAELDSTDVAKGFNHHRRKRSTSTLYSGLLL
jgi:hypothetical protein